jgi:mRNA interferase MazF
MNTNPQRGEVWLVNLDPTIGAEIKKTRPVVVISCNFVGKLPLKVVVPITDWNATFDSYIWHVRIEHTAENGLAKRSTADTLQIRSLDLRRFIRKFGFLPDNTLKEITDAIHVIIE